MLHWLGVLSFIKEIEGTADRHEEGKEVKHNVDIILPLTKSHFVPANYSLMLL